MNPHITAAQAEAREGMKAKHDGIRIVYSFSKEELNQLIADTFEKGAAAERERCAVTVWNYLATFEDCLEPTQRTNALIQAVRKIRALTPADYKE